MRIHTNTLSDGAIHLAAQRAGAFVEELEVKGSRKRHHAFEVKLSGSSSYAAQGGQWKAATWDEWGVFLARLFELEPGIVAGPYNGSEDFERQTRESLEAFDRYERIVGRRQPGRTAPWLAAA